MKRNTLYALWGFLFIICGGLGFIPAPTGGVQILLTILSLGFFLPPAVLIYGAVRSGHRPTLQLIRNLSALSLGLTLLLLVLNVTSALISSDLGDFLHSILIIVSSPMIASGHWALSLFLWACLLMVCLKQLRKP